MRGLVDGLNRSEAHRTRPGPGGGLPRLVWAATAAWVALLLVWTVAKPMYRSPDEKLHVSAAVHLSHHGTWPGFKQLPIDAGVEASASAYGVLGVWNVHPVLHSDDALDRDRRPSFTALGAGNPLAEVATVGQHPPGYYAVLGAAHRVLPDDLPADQEVWVMRMVSVMMMAPLPLLVVAGVRRLGGSADAWSIGALLPLCIPGLAALGASVNNDNLLNLAAAWAALGIAVIATGDLRPRTGALVGLAVAVALLAKAFALVLVPVVAAAYLVAGRRSGGTRRILPGLASFASVAMLGGWWWVHNLIRYGRLQPAGHGPIRAERISVADGMGDFLGHAAGRITGRFWAVLGIKGDGEVALPAALTGLLSLLLVALLVAALVRRRTAGATRTDVCLLLAPFGLALAVLLVSTWNLYSRMGYPAGLQGRYLFVGLPGVLMVAALVISRWSSGRAAPVLAVIGGWATALTLYSLHRVAQFHWGVDRDSLTGSPGAVLAWSPLGRWMTLGLGAVFVVALAGLGWSLVERWRIGQMGEGAGERAAGTR